MNILLFRKVGKKLTGSSTGLQSSSPSISTLDMSEENTNILYYGSEKGRLYRLDSCRTNNAAAKVDITSALFPANAYVSCVEVDRLNHNNVLVTFSNYGVKSIFYSADAGNTWVDVSGNLEQNIDGSGNGPSVTWAHIYNDGISVKYFVGTSIGLFSADILNGTSTVWSQEGSNTIGNVVINMITSRVFDNNIVVATHGNGMYSNKVFTPSSIKDELSDKLQVNCFPNPFSGEVVIEFNNASQNQIEGWVYDLSGRIINSVKPTSSNKAYWNGKDVEGRECSSGTYLIKVVVNGNTIVKKVVRL